MSGNVKGTTVERWVWGIDKITIRVHKKYVNCHFKPLYFYENNGIVNGINVINHNQYYYINFHDCLFLDPSKRLSEVIIAGMYALYFAEKPLLKEEPNWKFLANETKLSECEIFFDSFNFMPYVCKESSTFWNVCKGSTLYTRDYKKKYRKNGELKETQHSLICLYNRSLKFGFPEPINRFEYRLRGKYVRNLHIVDLNSTFANLYVTKLLPIMTWYTDRLLNQNMIEFDFQMLQQTNHPLLHVLLKCKNWGRLARFYLGLDQIF